jgi:hypothetical protein
MAALVGLMMVVLPLGLFGGVIALVVRWAAQQRRLRAQAWGGVAQRLGLQYGNDVISGYRHGRPVRLAVVVRGSGKNQQSFTVASSMLPMPLDVGFAMRAHGFFEDLFRGGRDIPIGDPVFDQRFMIQGDEDHRVRALLTPSLRHLLLTQLAPNTTFSLSDQGMVVETRGVTSHAPWLEWALELVARTTLEMERARPSVPVATPLAPYANAWARYAQARGLQGMNTPLCMWGSIEGANVSAFAVRTANLCYALEVQVRLASPLGLGLMVKPQHTFDRLAAFFGAQDHELGDPAFDEAFVIKVQDTARVGEVLDAPVRAALLGLHHGLGPLTLTDEGMSVRLPSVPRDPAAIPRALGQLTHVAESLAGKGHPSAQVGAYR